MRRICHPKDSLQESFSTRKIFNGRNSFLFPYVVRMPYYIFLGTSQASATSNATVGSATRALPEGIKMENGLMTPDSPWTQKTAAHDTSGRENVPESLELGDSAWDGTISRQLSARTRHMS